MVRSTELLSAAGYGSMRNGSAAGLAAGNGEGGTSHHLLANGLEDDHGFFVQSLPEAQSLLDGMPGIPDGKIIVIDGNRPRPSADVLAELRRMGIDLPVVVLTGRGTATGEMLALDWRALDDVVDKAGGVAILVRRLGPVATFRQTQARHDKDLRCGRLLLKPCVGRAFWDDVDVDLTLGEFKIVHLLARNAGQHVTYRDIYDCLHYRGFIAGNGEDGYRTNVRSAIKRVRGKFRACDPNFSEIENYPGFGYVWGRERSAA